MGIKSMAKNRDVFLEDPTTYTIPNNGVTQVIDPRTPEQWDVLRYELKNFVCEGEYQRGLSLVLSTYIAHLSRTVQPAVWVSGFYGSGKSHFVRVLEYLWRDTQFPDGVRARGLTKLPGDIAELFKELTTVGRREGGLWSAAGTLGSGAGKSVRLALLGIMFRSSGLPEQYAPTRFILWLMQNNYYKDVKASVERNGRDFAKELNNMYVSPVLAQSLMDVIPGFANGTAEARSLLRMQYPNREDISDDELLRTMEDVFDLQSNTPGKLPCTLLVFDELQQFIGEDPQRTSHVQNVVEACSSRFGNHLLFVATGQAAIQATPQLQKLQGRFTVRVTLTDTDVEQVVREVVLRKNPTKITILQDVLNKASGEIDRQLAGTKIGPRPTDNARLVSDYPLLPVRSRFWESILRSVDSLGTAGQLRTQLRIVHDAIKEVADRPIGTVVAGDVIYHHLEADMLQNSMLLRDVATTIKKLDDDTPDGKMRSRLCAAIFLIGKLPVDGVATTGIRANVATLADLLVEDVTNVSANAMLRQSIPHLLQSLIETGMLMQVGDEYRLQTRESAEWETDYQRRRTRIRADDSRIASDRMTAFQSAITGALKGVALTQGLSKTPRKFETHFGFDPPQGNTSNVPLWIRDAWSVSEKTVRDDAQAAGVDSPIVFVFLPQQDADALKDALASYAAAHESLSSRPTPTTPEGLEAKSAMESKRQLEQRKRDALIAGIVNNARVYQGGGNEIVQGTLQASVKTAIEAALERLFPKFKDVDHPSWNTVITRTSQGATDALSVIGYSGDVDKHPACQEIRTFIGGPGKKGSEIRKYFMGAGYGWPQDAVDGALLSLVASGFVRATRNGQLISVKQITVQQLGLTDFYSEGITVSVGQKIGIRKLVTDMGLPIKQGEELEAIPIMLNRLVELAATAGGNPPLPERPSTASIEQMQSMSGNEQLVAVYERRDELLNCFKAWTLARDKNKQRYSRWNMLNSLLLHARKLPIANEVDPQISAIINSRTLLDDPDPVSPLINKVAAELRSELQRERQRLADIQYQELKVLEASQEWQKLTMAERQRLLNQNALGPIPQLTIGTDEELLAALHASPIDAWENKTAATAGRVKIVREEAAKKFLPQVIHITPPQAILQSTDEVDTYLAKLRDSIMTYIEAGNPVII
jgi:hypothetical protein